MEEDDQGVADGEVVGREDDLDGAVGDLEGGAEADAREDLVAEPLRFGAAQAEGLDERAAGREGERAEAHERDVVAQGRDEGAGDDGGGEDGDEVGEDADAGAFGCGAFDGLEVEGEVVDVGVDGHVDEADVEAAECHAALGEYAYRDRGSGSHVRYGWG